MNNKSVLAMSFLVFNFSLFALADDAPTEVVVTGQQPPPPQYSPNAPVQTSIEMPKSSGDSQYSSEGYIKAMAEKAAAEEKGRRLQACYQQLASLDKSKYACSDDGELIDLVEVTGVKDTVDQSPPSLVNEAYNSLEELARIETEAIKKEQQDKYCKSQPSVINLKQQTCIYDATRFTTGEANKCSNFSFDLSWIAGISYSPSCRSYWAGEQATQVQLCNVLAAEAVAALAKECP